MNFNSSDIKIYPAANRNVLYDPYADLMLEQNITDQIKHITDYPSYIIKDLDVSLSPIAAGLYASDGSLVKSWAKLLSDGDIAMTDGWLKVTNVELGGDLLCDNIEELTSLSSTFLNCSRLTSIDLNSFNTSRVINMHKMFQGCSALTELYLKKIDTINVTDMHDMFNGCENLVSLDLSNFKTNSVTDMQGMFFNCSSISSLDISNFDTSKVTKLNLMFYGCSSLTSLDLSSFDTNSVTDISYMFNGCSKLTKLDISNFDFSKVTTYTGMFIDVPVSCEILVKDESTKNWINTNFPTMTNVKIKQNSSLKLTNNSINKNIKKSRQLIKYKDIYINKGQFIFNGYYLDIKSNTTILQDISKLEYPCYVYFELSMQETGEVTQIQGIDEISNDKFIYTGVNIIISTDDKKDTENNYFRIAEITKDNEGNIEITNIPKGRKYKAENIKVTLQETSGLVKENYSGTLDNWLNNEFIIDDQNI